jgi:hypothetical protein
MDGGRAEDGIIWRGNNYGMVQGLLYYYVFGKGFHAMIISNHRWLASLCVDD